MQTRREGFQYKKYNFSALKFLTTFFLSSMILAQMARAEIITQPDPRGRGLIITTTNKQGNILTVEERFNRWNKIIYYQNNLPHHGVQDLKYGPIASRNIAISFIADPTTNKITKSIETSSFGIKTIFFDSAGNPLQARLVSNYGPRAERTVEIQYTCDAETGQILKEIEQNSQQTKTTIFDSNDNTASVIILKNYGPTAGRRVVINNTCDAVTGLFLKSVEETELETKNTLYE